MKSVAGRSIQEKQEQRNRLYNQGERQIFADEVERHETRHENLALLAVFFRLMATATFAFAELFYFMPLLILGGDGYLKTFSPAQLNALALLSLTVSGTGGSLFVLFYGIASMLLGYLMVRSGYLPGLTGMSKQGTKRAMSSSRWNRTTTPRAL